MSETPKSDPLMYVFALIGLGVVAVLDQGLNLLTPSKHAMEQIVRILILYGVAGLGGGLMVYELLLILRKKESTGGEGRDHNKVF